jgi:hypothetical protein
MNAVDIAGVALGILGRVTEGISQAIAAARANNEEEAFDLLEKAIQETADGVRSMRARLAASRQAALDALAARFPSDG